MAAAETTRSLSREEFLRGTAGLAAAGTGMGLLVPSALPYLFAGFKIAAPSAVLGAITAEWAGADRGVGAMMLYALFSYDTPKVWLAVLLTCILAGSGYGLWALIERVAIHWNRDIELGA